MSKNHMINKYYWALACIFLLALAVRIAAVWAWGDAPVKDQLQYHTIAVNLLSGHGYALIPDVPTMYRPPAYPAFLVVLYSVFGQDYHYVFYAQALLNAMLVFPLFWLARRMSGAEVVGVMAAGLFAVHPSFEIVSRLHAENLQVFLGVGFVSSAYLMSRRSKQWLFTALVCGGCAGLMGLTKPEYALLGLGFLLFGVCFPSWRARWRQLSVIAVVSLLFVGGWQIRNYSVPVSDAVSKPIVNNNILTAYYHPAITGQWWLPITDMKKYERYRDEARDFYASINNADVVRSKALQEMANHPAGVAQLVLSRVLVLWFSPPAGSSVLAGQSEWLRWLVLCIQYIFVIGALGMMFFAVCTRVELLPFLMLAAYMTSIYGLIHSIRRYDYPFFPELCIFFAWALWTVWRSRKKSFKCDELEKR